MAEKYSLYGMDIGRGWLRGLMWGVGLLCYSLLLSPLHARAEMCAEIDFNKPTIAGGYDHTVGLKKDGTVVAVGDNLYGQTNVSGWTNIKAIAAGWLHTVGLKEDGTVVAVGVYNYDYAQTNVSGWANIKAIAAGYTHTVGLKEDGTVVAAGHQDFNYGQTNVSRWANIKAIAAGGQLTVGLKEDGTVVAAGNNWYGQLNVSGWSNIKAIAAGGRHTVGLKEDGTVVAVGLNDYGQTNVSSWTNIKAIAAGYLHTVGLKEDGTVVAVGFNHYEQTNVSGWTNIKAIAVGWAQTYGLKEDGTVVAVGGNWHDQTNVSGWTNIRQPACLNNPPTASAGPDQTIECAGPSGASVTLNGSGSSDPDSDPLTYTWTWTGGSAEGVSPTVTLPLGTTVVTLTASDGKATATDTVNITVQDKTPPVTTATGGSDNWYNANVISTFSATDSCSGVKEVHYTVNGTETVLPGNYASLTLTVEGIYNVAYYSLDNAGNAESPNSMTVKIDKTPPTITGTATTSPNANGWYNTDVTVTFTCTDSKSGIAQCPSPITVSSEGAGQVVGGTAVDKAGNSASTSVTLNIDKTSPVLSISTTPNILWPPNHEMADVLIGGSATDAASGISSVLFSVSDEYGVVQPLISNFNTTIQLEAWREGTDMDGRHYTITAVAADAAGNKTTTSTTVLVPHDQGNQ